ncbi:hypothetical protein CLAIMM_07732 isoform 5 [Cladophialophora immunda]|nr:hypothetical protein CLAIMM_07732 isoform 2 [Cladophialophora immunda]OQV02550.1 hypothetical protein CLAIMM_07732 isoform 4 [Cladophialophora immunda]OQV02551.1 hypothetical protein CLAIMM_07732 isoform 5 [Cladophialophora immunda]
MREVTDVALQRLYWACRRRTGFPGDIPDESQGEVSTADILKGLGLLTPDLDDPTFLGEVGRSTPFFHASKGQRQGHIQSTTARREGEEVEKRSVASTDSASSSPRTSNERVLATSTTNTSTSISLPLESEVHTPAEEMDMKAQFVLASSLSPAPRTSGPARTRAFPSHDAQAFFHGPHVVDPEPQLDVDAFLDMSLCTAPTTQPIPSFYGPSMSFSVPTMATLHQFPYGQAHHPARHPMFDP